MKQLLKVGILALLLVSVKAFSQQPVKNHILSYSQYNKVVTVQHGTEILPAHIVSVSSDSGYFELKSQTLIIDGLSYRITHSLGKYDKNGYSYHSYQLFNEDQGTIYICTLSFKNIPVDLVKSSKLCDKKSFVVPLLYGFEIWRKGSAQGQYYVLN